MTEQQAIRAMKLLAQLYAEQNGFQNPEIIITTKEKAND